MTRLVGVLGSVTPPGRLASALAWAMQAAREVAPAVQADTLNLADYRLGFADGRPIEQLDDDSPAVVGRIAGANAIILASPVYRASFTGALNRIVTHAQPERRIRGFWSAWPR